MGLVLDLQHPRGRDRRRAVHGLVHHAVHRTITRNLVPVREAVQPGRQSLHEQHEGCEQAPDGEGRPHEGAES